MAINTGATLAEVVQNLSELTGVNQKADLKTVLMSKGLTIPDTDTVADMVTKLGVNKLVLDGKKFATGTGSFGGATMTIKSWYASSGDITASPRAAVVTGLTFLPSIILVLQTGGTTRNGGTLYFKPMLDMVGLIGRNVDTFITKASNASLEYLATSENAAIYINNTGFKLPLDTGSAVQGGFSWIAIE